MTTVKKTQKQIAYEKITAYIFDNNLNPGAPLDETTLTEITNTSRTPVRESLHQLAQEGLVEIIPKRGTFVATISLADIRELFQLREAVEGYAARLAATKADLSELIEIENLFIKAKNEVDPNTRIQLHCSSNERLHRYVLETCGNSRFVKIDNSYHNLLKLEINLTNSLKGVIEKSYDEHTDILQALKQRDPDLSEQMMRKHILSVYNNILEVY